MSDNATHDELAALWQRFLEQGLQAWTGLAGQPAPAELLRLWAPVLQAWAHAGDGGADPLGQWKKLVDESLEAWTAFLARSMERPAFAALNAQLMEQYLNAVGPLRTALRTTGEEVLRAANLPSRTQVTGLASQLVAMDARLEAMEERLEGLGASLAALAALLARTESPRPPRGRKTGGPRRPSRDA
jgi:hypothetical protein